MGASLRACVCVCVEVNVCICWASPAGFGFQKEFNNGKTDAHITKEKSLLREISYLEGWMCCCQWNSNDSVRSKCADGESVQFCTLQQCRLLLCNAMSRRGFCKSCLCQRYPAVPPFPVTPLCHLTEVFSCCGERWLWLPRGLASLWLVVYCWHNWRVPAIM